MTARELELRKRNLEIIEQRANGMTIAAIATRYSLSVNRIRQILDRAERVKQYSDHFLGGDCPCRIYNALVYNEGITTLEQLRKYSHAELLRIPNFGRTSLKWLIDKGLIDA